MDKNSNNIRVIQLSNYVTPKVVEKKSKEWVLNGDGNSFFNYVIDRYNGSPTNGAIIRGFVNLIYGKGLTATDALRKPREYARMMLLLKPDEVRKMVMDFKLQHQFAMQIVYNNDKSINSITHFPVETLAPEKKNEKGEIEAYYYSKDWQKPKGENEPIRIDAFGTGGKREIYVCKPYEAGKMYFSLPDYVQGLQYAEIEEEISNFYINHIKNGFSFGYIVNFNNGSTLNEEQKDHVERSIKKVMTGSSNAGNIVVSFNNGKEAEVTIVPLEVNDAHNQWDSLNREAEEKIMRAHKVVSPMLFGIKNNTGLGNNADELDTAMSLLMDMSINPMQEFIVSKFNDVLAVDGIYLDLYFDSYVEDEVADVDTSFTGIQISSALDIISKVNNNELSKDQGKSLLRSMLSYPENELENIFSENTQLSVNVDLESYTDYPQGATNNAKRALEWAEKNGWGSCGTPVGKTRANQLANREAISLDTVKRMALFSRHQQHKDVPYSEGCGGLMWDAWGGDSGIRWAETKVKELGLSLELKTDKEANSGVADELIKLGEVFDPEQWDILTESEVDYETDEYTHDLVKIGLSTSTGVARPNSKSEQDSEDIAIRYRYVGNKNPQRPFCKKMIEANKVYRKEDIIQMENKAVNPGWGLNGADTYSIWLYKGGGNCRHKWNRVIYLKKNGSVDVNSPLAKTITTSEARRRGYDVPVNENLVSIEPNKMPNKGFVNK